MKKTQALLFAAILSLSSMSLIATSSHAQDFSKLPVAELFVYIGCHYCVYAEDAIPEVMTSTGALVLEYHIWSDQAGWRLQEGDALASSYGIQGTPAMVIDGVTKLAGADPSGYGDAALFQESCRNAYISAVNARPQYTNMGLNASLSRAGSEFSASVTVSIGPEPPSNLAIRMVAFETHASHEGRAYRNVVRAMFFPEEISSEGTASIMKTFTTPPKTSDATNIRIAALLFDTDTGEIYQSAYSGQYPAPAGVEIQNPQQDERSFSTVNIMLIVTAIALGAVVLVRWRKV